VAIADDDLVTALQVFVELNEAMSCETRELISSMISSSTGTGPSPNPTT
jgi:hypothetical protein